MINYHKNIFIVLWYVKFVNMSQKYGIFTNQILNKTGKNSASFYGSSHLNVPYPENRILHTPHFYKFLTLYN